MMGGWGLGSNPAGTQCGGMGERGRGATAVYLQSVIKANDHEGIAVAVTLKRG